MKKLLIVDDDSDLTCVMADLFKDSGFSSLVSHSVDQLKNFGDQIHSCAAAILDINLGANQPNGLEAYHWLRENRFAGRILFFTGHARSHPLVRTACQLEGVQVVEKPMTVEGLLDLVKGLN